MKHLLLGLATVALLATSCKKESAKGGEKEEVSTTESDSAVTYALDSAQSVINWQGYKISDGTEGGHYGTIQFQSSGEFSVKDSALVSGNFSVNMGSLVATDIEDEGKRTDLEVHLKNEDFFKVEDFPEAKFEITEVNVLAEGEFNTEIKGNFSIKDQTKN